MEKPVMFDFFITSCDYVICVCSSNYLCIVFFTKLCLLRGQIHSSVIDCCPLHLIEHSNLRLEDIVA